MTATIAQLIGKINPDYAENKKDLLNKYKTPDNIPAEEVKPKALGDHELIYDSASSTLEPVYFFILDLMNDFGLSPDKLVDNFMSSPGSGHFSELGQRATIMQQQATKVLGDINTVLRSVLNIIYDLKEFKLRLSSYDALKGEKKDAAVLSLKQIWLDKVDIQKGNSSIKAMSLGQAGFQTLLDAFLVVKDVRDVDKIDLNDRVKRILRPRILEFNDWLKNSGEELRRRYEIERNYLKSQVNALKLYSRWARPYLMAARDLEMKTNEKEPAIVKAFNTIVLELTLLGKQEIKVKEEAFAGNLPKEFEKLNLNRKYYSCVLVEFKFRGIPQRVAQQSHYVFGGRAEMSFHSYALNEDEVKKLNSDLDKSDINNVLDLIQGSTTESLSAIQDEIQFFLDDKQSSEETQKDKVEEDFSNPFKALVGGYNKPNQAQKKSSGENVISIKKENFAEKTYLRPLAAEKAEETSFKLFDIYKKAHGMVSFT